MVTKKKRNEVSNKTMRADLANGETINFDEAAYKHRRGARQTMRCFRL